MTTKKLSWPASLALVLSAFAAILILEDGFGLSYWASCAIAVPVGAALWTIPWWLPRVRGKQHGK